uniref:Uncharacterized protein n=1 Tax=Candidatus Kentrum sp. LFY TaxID=2126342 RepID=A0A450X232_9GAMM|nr:MAG: hypothetical protein BECKLFY1418C_GA0070996_11409 [Candidatus Kentron sp. LFY]
MFGKPGRFGNDVDSYTLAKQSSGDFFSSLIFTFLHSPDFAFLKSLFYTFLSSLRWITGNNDYATSSRSAHSTVTPGPKAMVTSFLFSFVGEPVNPSSLKAFNCLSITISIATEP